MGLAACTMAAAIVQYNVHPAVGIIIGLFSAVLVGIFNGLFVTKLKLPPLLVTLGMLILVRGLCYVATRYFTIQLTEEFAGSLIIWLGIGMFRARTEVVTQGRDLPYSAFTAGIITSGLNPFFLLWWATIGSLLVMRFTEFGAGGLTLFIIVHWLCDLFWLSLVAVVVYKTHSLWGRKVQEWVFIASSLLLAGFGIWFMVSGIQAVV